MLFKGILAISLMVAIFFYLANASSLSVLFAFALCFLILLIGWALSCVICTRFVKINLPCQTASPLFRFYANCIIDSLEQIFRVKLHITGLEKLPKEKFLLVGNHRSAMDPILEMGVFRKYQMGFVAKQELFQIPVIGKIMHKCFCFSLDRGSLRDGMKTMQQAASVIQSGEAAVGIYPEGTRTRDGKLLPFKNGAFKIAKKAGCPIVIVTIRNSEEILKKLFFKQKDVYIDVVDVIGAKTVAGLKTAELSKAVHFTMEQALENV